MIETYILLFIEFFQIGLFTIGGGYASLPFLYFLAGKYDWFSAKELTDMIAVSNVTPGPLGINMATYVGFKTAGVIGSLIATTAVILPSFIVILLIMKLLKQFKENPYVKGILNGLRPAACALLSAICIKLFFINILNIDRLCCVQDYKNFNIDTLGILLFSIFLIFSLKSKKSPMILIWLGGIFGILLHLL